MAESSEITADVEMASTPPAVNADNVPAAPAGPDSVPTGTKRTLEMSGQSPPDERPQRRAFRREAEEAIEPNASVPVARQRLRTWEGVIQEVKDNRSDDQMSHEQIEELLDYRPPDWADEEENEKALRAVPGLKRLLTPPSNGVVESILRLWKACLYMYGETPDFIFSGFIRFHVPGRPRVLEELAGGVPYPSQTIRFHVDLGVLINQPVWLGNVDFLRGALAFTVACRTRNTHKFPYVFSVGCKALGLMTDSCGNMPIWQSLMQVETGDESRAPTELLFREIVRLTQPPDIVMPTPSTEFGVYDVTEEDIHTLLFALNGVGYKTIRLLMLTEWASDSAMHSKCKQHPPSLKQLADLRRKSLLRHMYLKQQFDAGEEGIYKNGFRLQHCRKQLNKERQQLDEASDNWPGDFVEADTPAAVQPENEVKEETPEPSYADIEIDPDLRVKREPM